MSSQNISIKEPRVTVVIDKKGDTLIQFKSADAKIILKDVLDKQILDSVVSVYEVRDSLHSSTISLQKEVIRQLLKKNSNQDLALSNLDKIIENKDSEIVILKEINKKQSKEIRKQKIFKIFGFIGAVILPVLAILVIK